MSTVFCHGPSISTVPCIPGVGCTRRR
jgi:hypothetical protein